jgi:hypothetical protein
MRTHTEAAPAGLHIARWYLAAVAVLLLGMAAVTITTHLSQALTGTTLVFSQDDMREGGGIGPAPVEGEAPPSDPAEPMTVSTQFVDLPSLALTIGGGAVAAAGAVALFRRTRWAVPLGLAAAAVALGVGLIPASIGLWAVDYYALGDLGQVAPFFAISVALLTAALLCGVAVWRSRSALAPV